MSKIVLSGVVCLVVVSSAVLLFKNTFAAPPCPCTVFMPQTPTVQPGLYNEAGGIEVGMRFNVSQPGYISGARFYKVAGMTGAHTASIWNNMGARLATATFTSESAAGWQEIGFTPIAVAPGSLYTVSVFMADGNYAATTNYFNVPIVNAPLIAPQDGQAWDGLGYGSQGVYDAYGVSVYPKSSFNSTNYWVDTVYISSTSQAAPAVTAKHPAAGAANVAVSDAVSATFDKKLTPSSVSSDTFVVHDAQGQAIPGDVTYDLNTSTIKYIADGLLQTNATYTATLKGGAGNVITDYDGHALGADYQWSFTTSSTQLTCPCSLKNKQTPAEATTYREGSYPDGLELGLKIVPSANGYISAIRFYKPLVNEQMTHVGNIWDSNGTKLATVTFDSESEYGWQEATLAVPLSVAKDRVYIVSFGTTVATYMATINGLSSGLVSPGFAAYPSGDGRNTALGSGMANSVYATIPGSYPGNPSNNNDYVIDAVFSFEAGDVEPLRVVNTQPSADSVGVERDAVLRATFDQALEPSTVNAASFQVRSRTGALVAGQVAYDAVKRAVVFTPAVNLAAGERYTAAITADVQDVRGESLPVERTWSFTVGVSAVIDMNEGNGGPIAVITSTGDTYGKYYAEILRTEGVNYFDVLDIDDVTAVTLRDYRAVILSSFALTDLQVATLEAWVSGGGDLVAMRPDKKLSGLLGLQDTGGTLTNAYIKVDPATTPGLGIVSETMQYKGMADTYVVTDATTVAKLYADAATQTIHPAVTTRSVGTGTAMAYSYDLARSVISLHQGNQVWAGVDRNLDGTTRSMDLFYGAAQFDAQADWLDSNKMDIPQADEQQRLLINLLTDAMKDNLPVPRFWYLPHDQKAAMVFAGDDHNLSNHEGTENEWNRLLNLGDSHCSVMDWECARATNYIYTNSGLTNLRAKQFADYGFEVGAHPEVGASCGMESSYAQLNADFASSLATWRTKYSSIPHQQTARLHCYAWPYWDWTPRADYSNGVRYDLNTVAYPASWVNGRSPMVTGSGMNMRLTDANGALIDVRQGVTNFDNVSAGAQSIAAMLDNALGVNGYYGIFGSHYDMSDSYAKTLYDVAVSRQVPMITAEQALMWLDGRSGSNFRNLTSSEKGKVSFSIDVAEGAYGLQAMMPMQDAGGALVSIKLAGQPITYRTEIIKGVHYAIFTAVPGAYEVLYADFGANAPRESEATGDGSSVAARSQGRTVTRTGDGSAIVDRMAVSGNASSRPTRESDARDVEHVDEEATIVASGAWWLQPIVIAGGGGLVAVGAASLWLFKFRRRII